jgi:hypothetical protein
LEFALELDLQIQPVGSDDAPVIVKGNDLGVNLAAKIFWAAGTFDLRNSGRAVALNLLGIKAISDEKMCSIDCRSSVAVSTGSGPTGADITYRQYQWKRYAIMDWLAGSALLPANDN